MPDEMFFPTADFIGGPLDGMTLTVGKYFPTIEFPKALVGNLTLMPDNVFEDGPQFQRDVYRYIGHGAYLYQGQE